MTRSLVPRRMILFLLGMALVEASGAMTTVLIPVYVRSLGANVAQVGLFFTLSAITPVLLQVLGGWFSDALGRLRAFSLGSLAGILAYVSFALAGSWYAALVAPAFVAIAKALILPSYRGFIADQTRPENRGRLFGTGETVRNLTWILGPPLGGLLAQSLGFQWLFAAAGLTYAAAGVIMVVIGRVDHRPADTPQEKPSLASLRSSLVQMVSVVLSGGLITWLLFTDGLREVAFKMSFDFMPVYLTDIWHLSRQQIGLLDGIFGIVLVVASYPAGWLTDKASERVALVSGLLSVLTSRLVFALASGFWGFAFSWSLLALGGALMYPAIQSLISKAIPQRLRGTAYGFLPTCWGLVSLPSPWIGGLMWTHLGPQAPFLATVILGSLALIPAWTRLVVPKAVEETDQRERLTA